GFCMAKVYNLRIRSSIPRSLRSFENRSTTSKKRCCSSFSAPYHSSNKSSITSCCNRSASISLAMRNPGSISSKYAYCFTISKQKECNVEMDDFCNKESCFFRWSDVGFSANAFSSANPIRLRISCADRKSTRLNSSHVSISYAVFCLIKKKIVTNQIRPLLATNNDSTVQQVE